MKVIVVRLVGGLASQLHKYLVALSIAKKYDLEVKVDISYYTEDMRRYNKVNEYGLPSLGFIPEIATDNKFN